MESDMLRFMRNSFIAKISDSGSNPIAISYVGDFFCECYL